MSDQRVEIRPERRKYRHRKDKPPALLQHAAHLAKAAPIIADVFDDIEGSNPVEFRVERNRASVHLKQIDSWQTGGGERQTVNGNLASANAHAGKPGPKGGKHKSRAASNLQK